MSDQDIGKKMGEESELDYFIERSLSKGGDKLPPPLIKTAGGKQKVNCANMKGYRSPTWKARTRQGKKER